MASNDHVPKGLKIIVIAGGVVLLGGFILVVSVVFGKLSTHSSGNPRALATAQCAAQRLALPKGYDLDDIYHENGRVTVLLSSEKDSRVLIVDACSGEVLSDLTLAPDMDRPEAATPI